VEKWPPWTRVAVGGIAVIVFLGVFGWLWWLGVLELYRNSDGTVDNAAVAATRTGLLALLIGVGAVGTLWVNSRNLQVTTQTYKLTQQGQLHDRFTKANELLGDKDSPAVRLGGIYSLQQLAGDTRRPSDQAAVVEVLSAFVRMNFKIELDEPDEQRDDYDPLNAKRGVPGTDVLAAISVLAHLPDRGMMRADFTGVDLSAADLTGVRLGDGDLSNTNLKKAWLAYSDLDGAKFLGTNLRETCLMNTKFRGADLRKAIFRKVYAPDVDFSEADLREANVTWAMMPNATVVGADLRAANLYEAVLTGADLQRSKFQDANLE
jgi:hypothetical protein